jgi:hypothetical protein
VSVALTDPLSVALIIGVACPATTRDVTVNVAVVAPTATVTEAGTVAAVGVPLDRVTFLSATVPAAGALSVTVAVEFADPPTTDVGFSASNTTPGGGVTVRGALCVPPLRLAEIFAVLVDATVRLVTVKVADVAPTVIVTLAGIVAAEVLSLDSVAFLCAAVPNAGAFSVTVPVELVIPPGTLVGFKVTDATIGKLTVNVKLWTALEPTPLLAVNWMLNVPIVAGVPLSVPVPLWLSLNVTPLGSVPVSLSAGVGYPVVVNVNVPATPTVNDVLVALVIVGAEGFTTSPALAVRAYEPKTGRSTDKLSLPAALTETDPNVAPVPATVVNGPSPLAVPVPVKPSVTGTPPMFWPLSVMDTIGAGLIAWSALPL